MSDNIFTDNELDELDARFSRAMADKFDAYNETINGLQAENERLKKDRNNLLCALQQIFEGDYDYGEHIHIAASALDAAKEAGK